MSGALSDALAVARPTHREQANSALEAHARAVDREVGRNVGYENALLTLALIHSVLDVADKLDALDRLDFPDDPRDEPDSEETKAAQFSHTETPLADQWESFRG